MMRIHYNCDSCGKQLADDEAAAEQKRILNGAGKHEMDNFCQDCAAKAPDYWRAKSDLLVQIAQEASQRITNHKNKFFAK